MDEFHQEQSNVTFSTLSLGAQAAVLATDNAPEESNIGTQYYSNQFSFHVLKKNKNLQKNANGEQFPSFNEMPLTLFEINEQRKQPKMPFKL
jgi:hypothetical protein